MSGIASQNAIETRAIRAATSANSLIAVSLAVALAFSLICGAILWQERRNAGDHAARAMGNLVEAVTSDIARNIEQYDLSLQGVSVGLQLPEFNQVSRKTRQAILFDNSANYKYLGAMRVLDRYGKTLFDSRGSDAGTEDFSTEDFFLVHVNVAHVGLYISRPFKASNGEMVIALSRRLNADDGSFAGVTMGTLRLAYLHDLFNKVAPSTQSALTLFGLDGTVLMRFPNRSQDIGRNASAARVLKEYQIAPSGAYEHTAGTDGVRRLYAYSQVGEFPLVMVVGRPTDEVYAGWLRDAIVVVVLITALCGAMAFSSLSLRREFRGRVAAEEKLAVLATTDSLTGLANRRHFDAMIAKEWQRALRERKPVSLLMIDADLFKPYNDTHGHQHGDQLLKAVGACICDRARRATDLAARYGGDEFALLLPNVGGKAALEIAEQIRKKVRLLCMPSEAAPATASIGVATLMPKPGMDHRELIDMADKALYSAKAKGRDCCELAEPAAETRGPRLVASR
jgi:diguanylate cyclase (GGDEF)-like protein